MNIELPKTDITTVEWGLVVTGVVIASGTGLYLSGAGGSIAMAIAAGTIFAIVIIGARTETTP